MEHHIPCWSGSLRCWCAVEIIPHSFPLDSWLDLRYAQLSWWSRRCSHAFQGYVYPWLKGSGTKSQPAHSSLLQIWPSLFGLPPPTFLGVGLLYETFSFLDPLFLFAPSRFLHCYVGILLAFQSNGALVVVSYCLAVLYKHVLVDRQFVPLRPHYLLASVVHKSTRVCHIPICADFWGQRRILLCSINHPCCWVTSLTTPNTNTNRLNYSNSPLHFLLSPAHTTI